MKSNVVFLGGLRACEEAVEWASEYPDLEAAWAACQRGDWLLWLAAKTKINHKQLVLAACDCARAALPYAHGPEALKVIEAAEGWARGEVSIEVVRRAAHAVTSVTFATFAARAAAFATFAARAAAYAADAATYATSATYAATSARDAADAAAAYAADAATYATSATYAAAYAADAAAYAADAAAYAADAAARVANQAQCADIVRSHIPWKILSAAIEVLNATDG